MISLKNSEKLKSLFYAIVVPILLALINLVLKIRYVSYPSLAKDEPFSVYYAQFDLATIISELSGGNNPPLYEIFLHFWTSVFGISEFSVRFPSVVFSSLTVYFIYQICRKFFSLKAAILAAVLFTLSNYEMYFAHEARVYPLFMLLTVVSMFQYLKLMTLERSKIDVVFFVITNILLLYSHFFSWFVIFIQLGITISIYWNKKNVILKFAKYFGVIFLFYLPYVGIFITRFLDSSSGTWIQPVENLRPLHSFFGTLVNDTHVGYIVILIFVWLFLQQYITNHFRNGVLKTGLILLSIVFILISLSIRLPLFSFENDFSSPIVVVSFLLFYLFFFIHYQTYRNHSNEGKIIMSWFFIPGLIMFVASFSIPMFIDRYLIYITPAFFIVLSITISKFDHKLFLSISLITTILMAVSFSTLSNNQRDVKRMVNHVKKMQKDSNSAVFICPDYLVFTFSYYYNKNYFKSIESGVPKKGVVNALRSDNVFLVKNDKEVDSIFNKNKFDKIIYVDAAADFAYSDNNIKNYLKREFQDKTVTVDSLHVPRIFNIYSYQLLK